MGQAEPLGCLAALFGLIGLGVSSGDLGGQLPYRQRDDFLSPAELSFYRVLLPALDGSCTVCPKVNLADLFFVSGPKERQSHQNKISRKHVDFLLCDPGTMKPVLGIELDDSSHSRKDREERDGFVEQVFEAANLPLLRIRAATGYSPQQLADLIHQSREGVSQTKAPASASKTAPLCPKCQTPMVLRTARKGANKDESFWGCQNYPKCREIVHA